MTEIDLFQGQQTVVCSVGNGTVEGRAGGRRGWLSLYSQLPPSPGLSQQEWSSLPPRVGPWPGPRSWKGGSLVRKGHHSYASPPKSMSGDLVSVA